jgi:general secretion pathway protein L
LIFLDARNQFDGWMELRGGSVIARGLELEPLQGLLDAETRSPLRVAAIVPGEAVSLHWLEVPVGLAPAQAIAAARFMAAEVSVQPITEVHVAVGPEVEGDSARAVALVPAVTMAGWLGRLQAHGIDPDAVIPQPLLLPRPEEGFVRYNRGGEILLFRSRKDAFAAEPELGSLIVGDAPVQALERDAFEAAIGEQVAKPLVNLCQGAFAKRARWKTKWPQVRRLAVLGLAILLVTVAMQIVSTLRYTYAADKLELEANALAGETLRRSGPLSNAPAMMEQRLTELRGAGVGYSSVASVLFEAVRSTPKAELTAMTFVPDGSLHTTVQGDTPATLAKLQGHIQTVGLIVDAGPLRTGGGRSTFELRVRPR